MKNCKTLFNEVTGMLTSQFGRDEATSIAYIILEDIAGVSRTDIIREKKINLTTEAQARIEEAISRLNNNEPLQYILGYGWFYARKFAVAPSVLIPRPETEILVSTVIELLKKRKQENCTALDIGTGSGCIAVTLALELTGAKVFASDVSSEALDVARANARTHGAAVEFMQHDILKQDLPYRMFDVIVSNPPYVTESEQALMDPNVLLHEPHLALFVPDADPLIFYRAIAEKSRGALAPQGLLALEINEKFGDDVKALLNSTGFKEVRILRDLASRDRVVCGIWPT